MSSCKAQTVWRRTTRNHPVLAVFALFTAGRLETDDLLRCQPLANFAALSVLGFFHHFSVHFGLVVVAYLYRHVGRNSLDRLHHSSSIFTVIFALLYSFAPGRRHLCHKKYTPPCVTRQSGFGCIFLGLHPILYCTTDPTCRYLPKWAELATHCSWTARTQRARLGKCLLIVDNGETYGAASQKSKMGGTG